MSILWYYILFFPVDFNFRLSLFAFRFSSQFSFSLRFFFFFFFFFVVVSLCISYAFPGATLVDSQDKMNSAANGYAYNSNSSTKISVVSAPFNSGIDPSGYSVQIFYQAGPQIYPPGYTPPPPGNDKSSASIVTPIFLLSIFVLAVLL
jgi:hypothetical protein